MQVCVQGSMGEGALAGMPLQLAGTRQDIGVHGLGRSWCITNFCQDWIYRYMVGEIELF